MSQPKRERATGTVKFYDADRGFGFILTAQHQDIFLHCSDWLGDGLPSKGELVSFFEGVDRMGRRKATAVERAED
jgi:cold shock CspA family protein